jgi:hypothetical protein
MAYGGAGVVGFGDAPAAGAGPAPRALQQAASPAGCGDCRRDGR